MQLRAFLITALSATAAAQLNPEASELASVGAVIVSAIPATLLSALTNPAVASSLARDFALSSFPPWYTGLPSDVKDYINSVAAGATSDQPLNSTITSTSTSTSASSTSSTSSTSSRPVISAASASEPRTAQPSSTSTGGAPAPTGAIVASIAGVVGVLVLAVGL